MSAASSPFPTIALYFLSLRYVCVRPRGLFLFIHILLIMLLILLLFLILILILFLGIFAMLGYACGILRHACAIRLMAVAIPPLFMRHQAQITEAMPRMDEKSWAQAQIMMRCPAGHRIKSLSVRLWG